LAGYLSQVIGNAGGCKNKKSRPQTEQQQELAELKEAVRINWNRPGFLKAKEREEQQVIHIEDTQRLVTERLKCSALYCIWWRGAKEDKIPLLFLRDAREIKSYACD
jgi:hypothetical protein